VPARSLTLVTYLFDLARREPETDRTSVESYLRLADEFVLGIHHDLVVFAEPEFAERIEAVRGRRALGARTRVVPIAFEDLPAAALVPQIEAARAIRPLSNVNPRKDTSLYTALGWSKPELAARVAEDTPFDGSHVGWIDIGLRFRPQPGEDPFAHPSDRLRLLSMRPVFEHELADREHYLASLRGHVAAGYACGSRENMVWLGAAFGRLARESLDAGFAGSDEQLLPLLATTHPERFALYRGNYEDILANYLVLHRGAENLSFQLRVWREEGVPGQGASLAREVMESVTAGEFAADAEPLATLLDDCYVAAWYGEPEPHSLARQIAELYLKRAERDPALRDVFLRNEIHVRRNFSFLDAAR
jgi:hypothetical protein